MYFFINSIVFLDVNTVPICKTVKTTIPKTINKFVYGKSNINNIPNNLPPAKK